MKNAFYNMYLCHVHVSDWEPCKLQIKKKKEGKK